MTTSKWFTALAFAALILATALMLGYKSAAPEPTIVVCVQFQTLWGSLKARAEVEAELKRRGDTLQEELDRRRAAIEALEAERDAAVGEAQKTQLTEQIDIARLTVQYWHEITSRAVRDEEARRIRGLYQEIIKAVDELAELEGYDLVLLNDAGTEFKVDAQSRVPVQAQVFQQIGSRKILYADKRIDITGDLVDRMNNAWRAAAAAAVRGAEGG